MNNSYINGYVSTRVSFQQLTRYHVVFFIIKCILICTDLEVMVSSFLDH